MMMHSFLKDSYHNWSANEILRYYQTREHIKYFALRDEEQASLEKVEQILDNTFDFNHEMYHLPANFDWTNNPSNDKEWLILLHKFYYAVGLGEAYVEYSDERYTKKWLELTQSFIHTVPLDFLPCDVMGRRIQNWIFAHYYFVSHRKTALLTGEFYITFLKSLHAQVNYLCEHLTPARNHRTIELYAIFMAAVVFPEFNKADAWLEFCKRELLNNLQNDLLDDGVQCELSTDYHMLVLRNYLGIMTLARSNHIAMPSEMNRLINKALEFALYIHKPDGAIPSLSDGDSRNFLNVLKQGNDLYKDERFLYTATQGKQGKPPAERSKLFASSGYAVLRSGWGDSEPFTNERFLVFDCGPLGAGNHGHLDLLHFEMAAYGQSLIVDPGRYTYNEPAEHAPETNWRRLFRGTSYHNTVQVDNLEQTNYIFHKTRFKIRGPAPDHELKHFISQPCFDYLHGIATSHQYEVKHERKIAFVQGQYFIISDILEATGVHHYDLRFHLSDIAFNKTQLIAGDTLVVDTPHLILAQPRAENINAGLEDGFVSYTYGIKHQAPVVRFQQDGLCTSFHTVLYPYHTQRPTIKIQHLPLAHYSPQDFALEITVEQNHQTIKDIYFNAVSPGTYTIGNIDYNGSLLLLRQTETHHEIIYQQPQSTLSIDNTFISPLEVA